MLSRKRNIKLGTRVLKLGSRGTDVGQLQQKLKDFGYEPGPVDNIFGYLTQEALEFFQRDYRLRIDGIAGEEVFALLKQDNLPVTRRVHLVQPGETLQDIADQYQVGPEAFIDNHKKSIYPGQQLVFFDREVWGVLGFDLPALDSFNVNQELITGVFISVNPEKGIASQTKSISGPKIAQVEFEDEELVSIHTILTKGKVRKNFLKFCSEAAGKMDGIYLPWEQVSRVDGFRYYKLLRRIKKQLGDKRLLVTLTLGMPRWNLLGGIDFAQVSRIVDQVVIKIAQPDPSLIDSEKEQYESLIHQMLHYVPAYKILLSVPVYGVMWNQADPSAWERLSHGQAMTKVFRHGARLTADDSGKKYYQFYLKGEHWGLRISSLDQLNQVIALANRYNLAGIVLDCLGEEDKRLWTKLASHFSIRKKL